LANLNAVGRASFLIFYYRLHLQPNIEVYILVVPIVTYLPL